MMKTIRLATILCFLTGAATAQFAPQVPLPGNDAIPANDARIQSWAGACVVSGWKNLADTSLGRTTGGSEASSSGAPDLNVLSLGDGGSATLTLAVPMRNGAGPDFAVFENGFANAINVAEAFL